MNDIAAARRASTSGSSRGRLLRVALLLDRLRILVRHLRTSLPGTGSRRRGSDGAYCGSTSTANVTPACARSAATASTALAHGGDRRAARSRELDHELGALATLAAKQRRRAEGRQRRPPSMRSRTARAAASSGPGSSRRAHDPDQMAERRIARAPRAAPARPPGSPRRRARRRSAARGPSASSACTTTRPAARPAPAAAGELRDERERALLGAEVGEAQRRVGVEHHAERHVREVVALGDHLGADEHAGRRLVEAAQDRAHPLARDRCRSRAGTPAAAPRAPSSSRSSCSVPAPWRASDTEPQSGQASGHRLASARSGGSDTRPAALVQDERHVAVGAAPDAPADAGRRGSSTSRGG